MPLRLGKMRDRQTYSLEVRWLQSHCLYCSLLLWAGLLLDKLGDESRPLALSGPLGLRAYMIQGGRLEVGQPSVHSLLRPIFITNILYQPFTALNGIQR